MKRAILFFTIFCAITAHGQSYNSYEDMRKAEYKEWTKSYGAANAKKMMKGEPWIGMTDKMCQDELMLPNRKKTTYTKDGKVENWIYQGQADGCVGDCPTYNYVIEFKNHIAIAITTEE